MQFCLRIILFQERVILLYYFLKHSMRIFYKSYWSAPHPEKWCICMHTCVSLCAKYVLRLLSSNTLLILLRIYYPIHILDAELITFYVLGV